ncbi:hypothetical protein [Streptomyces sp. NPDC093707]|uniref:hypothetical protein n=1 Tax=Streptomyces sp. NPDC093707 TaxID=3154984 RepID=UPI00344D3993
MSARAWERWRAQVEEAWTRHRSYPELDRQLDVMQADFKVRSAWVDELSEKEAEEMLHGLSACLAALQKAVGDAPEHPVEGMS